MNKQEQELAYNIFGQVKRDHTLQPESKGRYDQVVVVER